ncbi:hypothetical protein [Kitasatospora sp. MBT66]|uniref:hypothetical protein n=1 Tax=Kitasatospora sp. MBT66 TaxID=1444769 RepID=UPI0005B8B9BE|nr:hypothetical protein [Kitasatospora sp. MBT66]
MFKSTATDQIVPAVTVAFPGLRQVAPLALGSGLDQVQIDRDLTARYACGQLTVHVKVGQADHLSGDPDDESLQRRVDAHASMLVQRLHPTELPAGEWAMMAPAAEMHFPTAYIAATDKLTPRSPMLCSRWWPRHSSTPPLLPSRPRRSLPTWPRNPAGRPIARPTSRWPPM